MALSVFDHHFIFNTACTESQVEKQDQIVTLYRTFRGENSTVMALRLGEQPSLADTASLFLLQAGQNDTECQYAMRVNRCC